MLGETPSIRGAIEQSSLPISFLDQNSAIIDDPRGTALGAEKSGGFSKPREVGREQSVTPGVV